MPQAAELQPIPFRVRIGVTGHRVLQKPDAIAVKIREAITFAQLRRFFDKTSVGLITAAVDTPIALTVVTPLAEGADRLVAREVLATPSSRIEVVLPFPKDEYKESFSSDESRCEFDNLFKLDRRPIVISQSARGNCDRGKAYSAIGRYVVDHCDVLIAVWDGEPAHGIGGTGEIVNYAIRKQRPVIHISSKPEVQTICHQGNGLNAESISGIVMFNRHLRDQTKGEGFKIQPEDNIHPEAKAAILEKLLPYYRSASGIAKQNQSLYILSGTFVYSASALAVAAAATGIIAHHLALAAFTVELVLLISILGVTKIVNRIDLQRRWTETRFLAERIRVALFFVVARIEISPVRIPPFIRSVHAPDDWMERVFDEIWDRLPSGREIDDAGLKSAISFIRRNLVKHQLDYHVNKAQRARSKNRFYEKCGIAIFAVAVLASIVHIGFYLWQPDLITIEQVITFLTISLPAVGAAIGGIHLHREYTRIEKRSENMVNALTDLNARYDGISSRDELRELLLETEDLMQRETQDWLMLMRFVKLETAA